MTINRYRNRKIKNNTSELIQKLLDVKNINAIRHYRSPDFKIPTYVERLDIKTVSVLWKRGDRLYKFAETYYSNPELWWVIAMYNNKPTDAHFTIGDTVHIPVDLANFFEYARI